MESTIEATGNKVDDLSYVHGFGMAQGLTQQGFSFINMELLGNFFNEFANKTKELVEPQAADTALRALAQTTENFQKILSSDPNNLRGRWLNFF